MAEHCPSAEEIKERNISTEYEWTVDESTSLQDLLSVNRLFAITLENNGEFISCKYKNENGFIHLDGIPGKDKCKIAVSSGEWLVSGKRKICDSDDLLLCTFDSSCE